MRVPANSECPDCKGIHVGSDFDCQVSTPPWPKPKPEELAPAPSDREKAKTLVATHQDGNQVRFIDDIATALAAEREAERRRCAGIAAELWLERRLIPGAEYSVEIYSRSVQEEILNPSRGEEAK